MPSKKRKYQLSPEFRYWAEARGFTTTEEELGHYWYGKTPEGRNMRALGHVGILQIDDGNFDRWANSVGAEVSLPWTEDEFDKVVSKLREFA